MSTKRAAQLEKLALSFPQQNAETAQAAQQARTIQLQDQVRGLQPGTGSPGLAQKLGGQQASKQGQIQLGEAQANQQGAQMTGQLGLEEKARGQRQKAFEQQTSLTDNQREIANRLSKFDIELKNKLLDDQLQFTKDSAGQDLMNERQLLDWAATKAESSEEFANYQQQLQQTLERELQVLEASQKKILQELNFDHTRRNRKLDQETKKELAQMARDMEAAIKKKKAAAQNRMAIFQAVGAIGGAVAGSFAGNPAQGALLGASVGQGIGTTVGGLTE